MACVAAPLPRQLQGGSRFQSQLQLWRRCVALCSQVAKQIVLQADCCRPLMCQWLLQGFRSVDVAVLWPKGYTQFHSEILDSRFDSTAQWFHGCSFLVEHVLRV